MSEFQFRVGDRVVLLPSGRGHRIVSVDCNDDDLPYEVEDLEDFSFGWVHGSEIELFVVFESPLYQALK